MPIIAVSLLQESILPNIVFLCLPIFTIKLSHIVTEENDTITIKLSSLIAKKLKLCPFSDEKKIGKITSRFPLQSWVSTCQRSNSLFLSPCFVWLIFDGLKEWFIIRSNNFLWKTWNRRWWHGLEVIWRLQNAHLHGKVSACPLLHNHGFEGGQGKISTVFSMLDKYNLLVNLR